MGGMTLQTEFINSMHCNYERIHLPEKPEERKYQYCILGRGGISGLLPCSLRYIDDEAYLYYDITSKQSVGQLFRKKRINRKWVRDFLWNIKHIQQETERFLLSADSVIWYPEQLFQDLDSNVFSVMYVPYYAEDNGFMTLLEFMVEKLDYEDDGLVDFVYKAYEQYEQNGATYLAEKIFLDAKGIEGEAAEENHSLKDQKTPSSEADIGEEVGMEKQDEAGKEKIPEEAESIWDRLRREDEADRKRRGGKNNSGKSKGLLSFLDSSRKRNAALREGYRQQNLVLAESGATDMPRRTSSEEEIGKTVYIERNSCAKESLQRRLYDSDGRLLRILNEDSCVIGKKRDTADLILDNPSISRIHARIFRDGNDFYLEDLNSTNGTLKNDVRLSPYEKQLLHEEDEILLGDIGIVFR